MLVTGIYGDAGTPPARPEPELSVHPAGTCWWEASIPAEMRAR